MTCQQSFLSSFPWSAHPIFSPLHVFSMPCLRKKPPQLCHADIYFCLVKLPKRCGIFENSLYHLCYKNQNVEGDFWGDIRPLQEAVDRLLKCFNWWGGKRLDNTGRHSAYTKANRSERVKGLWRPSYSIGHIIFGSDGLWLNRYEETTPSLFYLAVSLSHATSFLPPYSQCAKPHYYSADLHDSYSLFCVVRSLLLKPYDACLRERL